jgi:hypothetical protein
MYLIFWALFMLTVLLLWADAWYLKAIPVVFLALMFVASVLEPKRGA